MKKMNSLAILSVLAFITSLSCNNNQSSGLNVSVVSNKVKENGLDKDQMWCLAFDSLKVANEYWFNSWSVNLCSLGNSQCDVDSSVIQLSWDDYDVNVESGLIDSLWFKSEKLYADLYSYNLIVEKSLDTIEVSFGVDCEVYLLNSELTKIARLIHTSGYEVIEDAAWVNDDLVLFGYTQEESNKVSPVVWMYSTESRIMLRVHWSNYEDPMDRSNYFYNKHW